MDISSDMIRSSISGNDVVANRNEGGGFWNASGGSLVLLNGVDVNGNIATEGGGFYQESDGARVELTDVVMDGNTGRSRGGGFYNVSGLSEVELNNVEITNNQTNTEHGGGFRNQGQVIGQDVVISGNTSGATDHAANNNSNNVGGGFYNTGSIAIVNLERVEITDNLAHGRGGGFYNSGSGQVTLTDFIVSGNATDQGTSETQGRGAGFWNSSNSDVILNRGELSENESFGHGAGFYQQDSGSTVTATNATISGNKAGIDQTNGSFVDRVGGGFWALSTGSQVNLDHVTISNNQTTRSGGSAGGGFRVETGVATNLENSIVFGNLTNFDAAPLANNDIDNNSGALLTVIGDNALGVVAGAITSGDTGGIITADPLLAVLTDNGGSTVHSRTHSLLPTSSAIDVATGSTETVDGRGFSRTFAGNVARDVGAFEVAPLEFTLAGGGYRVRLDAATMTQIEIVDDSTSTVVASSPYASTVSVVLTGSALDERVIVDHVNGDPLPSGGLDFDGMGEVVGDDLLVEDSAAVPITTFTTLQSVLLIVATDPEFSRCSIKRDNPF